MIGWIYNLLYKRLQKRKHEVIKLRWQKAELEATLHRLKESQNEHR